MKPAKMAVQRNSEISLAILLICLCLGSLVVIPTLSAFSPSTSENSETGAENNDPSYQTEFDEELLLEAIVGIIIAHLVFSKFGPINLDFQTACLALVSPPPKYA